MVEDDRSFEPDQSLWLVKSREDKKERLESKDLPTSWEKAPKGAMLFIGNELVAVKE